MRAAWLFLLLLVAYVLGPLRAETGPSRPSTLGGAAAVPFARMVHAIYPTAAPVDQALWSSRLAGAFWAAAAGAATFLALEPRTTPMGAYLLSFLAAFASPLWSGASRSDAPQAPAAFVVAAVLCLAARRSHVSALAQRAGDVATGVLCVLLFLLDSTLVLAPAALMAWGLASGSGTRPRDAVLAAVGAAAGALVALLVFPTPRLADAARLSAFDLTSFAAHLVSPGRGLVFFAPLVVLAAAALVRGDGPPRLVRGGALVWLAALAETASLDPQLMPQGFGPVTLAPYVPVLAVMAAPLPLPGVRWGAVLALPVAAAHAGAVFLGGHTWEARRAVALHPEALWDVRDSPFSDLVLGPPEPQVSGLDPRAFPMAPGEHPMRAGQSLPWLLHGWETAEPNGTWASGRESWIVVAVPPGDYVLTLMATAPRVRGRPQRLAIERPGGPPLEITFADGLWNVQPLPIPFRPEAGVAVFKLRPAHLFMPGHGDVRRLSVFVTALWLEPSRPPAPARDALPARE
ncbi:MAG TPA: hypothetical protein VLL75_13820 [Vicinamibacteria bacterium]|nr:hypothetical protein [Vicinamibacteria bacterium]